MNMWRHTENEGVLAMDYQLLDMWELDNEMSVYRDLIPFKPSHY